MTFLDYLLKQTVITQPQYQKVLDTIDTEFHGNVTTAVASLGIAPDVLTQAMAGFYRIPYKKVSATEVPSEVLRYIEEDAARHYKFVPIAFSDGVLSVGVTEPDNIETMNALQFISAKLGVPFKIFLIAEQDLLQILENYKGVRSEVDAAITELNTELVEANEEVAKEKKTKQKEEDKANVEKIVEDAPIIKIVAVIINHAIEGDASDIHIEHTGDKVKVRYRVDGTLHTTLVLPLNTFDAIIARVKILSKLRLDEKRKPQDGSFATMIEGRKIEFRVSTFPAYYGEKVVMRILDSERGVKPLESLDFSEWNYQLVTEAIAKPHGLILITGPTGSGKSTTLYSMLNTVDREGNNVVSLEDPVEYQVAGISQSQVMPEIGYTFANGLRSILRQDPDIIMVGEIRDKETAQLAIQAALTGHLVFSTLHTNTAIGAIPRLVDMGIDPYLIAPTLRLIIAQRLVRKVHPSARKKVPMDHATQELVTKQFADLPEEFRKKFSTGDSMYEIVPSPECPSGTRGRLPVFEMFAVDKDMQELILKNPVEPELYKLLRAKGMLTLREDALLKALKGDIMMQEVFSFG
ncbi:MAG TPA: GspE/PulE family protein [Candidatus Paceibacterota bacterium]|nr:GspE/PulE family protein [Candidatus Paceibacterota bacterium]